jgi:hypothetical protein
LDDVIRETHGRPQDAERRARTSIGVARIFVRRCDQGTLPAQEGSSREHRLRDHAKLVDSPETCISEACAIIIGCAELFRLTDVGSPMLCRNQECTKCTCEHFRIKVLNGRFPVTVERCPCRHRTAMRSSIGPKTARLMVVYYDVKGTSAVFLKPREWSGKSLADLGMTPNFDLVPDGKRFAALMPATGPEPQEMRHHVTLLLNFFDEVRRKLPVP